MQSGDNVLNSTDHDHVVQHLTPSVNIVMNAPQSLANALWYGGSPTVILKDSIFEHSTAFRHAAELLPILSGSCLPFLFGITDGGPDHNTLNIQTQLSLVALFIVLDLDFLCFVRTPPHFSTLNPIERLMCVINLALNGVALSRVTVGEKEKYVEKLLTKDQWREAAKKHPNLNIPQLAQEGVKPAKEFLENRIKSMYYKGEPINICEAAEQQDIDQLKKVLAIFFPEEELKFDNVSKPNIMKNEKFKKFFDLHVRETVYGLQIKKCNDITCEFHELIRVPAAIFNDLNWLPSPKVDPVTGQYRSFEEVYGNEPNDDDRPGKTAESDNKTGPTGWSIATQRARIIRKCSECDFPRVLYSKNKLTPEEVHKLNDYFEDNRMICGEPIDFVGLGIQEIFMKNKIYCSAKVSIQYYSLDFLEGYELICSVCLDNDVPPQENRQPLCTRCIKNL